VRGFSWVAGFLLLLASRALAQAPLPLELAWNAPSECPTGDDVRAELGRIANVKSGLSLRRLIARVEVGRRNNTYIAVLRTEHDGRVGQRQLEAASCPTLVRSVTLVLALAFGAGVEVRDVAPDESNNAGGGRQIKANTPQPSAASSPQPSAASSPQPSAAMDPHSTATSAPPAFENAATTDEDRDERSQLGAETGDATDAADANESESRRGPKLNLSLVAGAQFGVLPSVALAAGLGVELETLRFSLGVRVLLMPGVTKDLPATPSDSGGAAEPSEADPTTASNATVAARFAAFGAELRGCALFPFDAVTFAACAALETAAIRGTTDEAANIRADAAIAPRYAVGAGVAVDWPRATTFRLRFEANLAIALNRPRFEIENLASAFVAPRWSPRVAAGLVVTP
jgi:hypothetical protein